MSIDKKDAKVTLMSEIANKFLVTGLLKLKVLKGKACCPVFLAYIHFISA